MAEMGKYCKAYHARALREFSGWKEDVSALRVETRRDGGKESEVKRSELKDDDILYLHDNYVVTDGIFRDEHVVFGQVTQQWKQFCKDELKFSPPEN